MNELTFIDIITRIEELLSKCDDDDIAFYYNQMFETPIIAVGDGLWEEEYLDDFNGESDQDY